MGERRGMEWEGRKRSGGWEGGEREEDVEGPGKWSAPGPVLALGGPGNSLPEHVVNCKTTATFK